MRARGEKKMGFIRVTVGLRATAKSKKSYRAEFLVDTGATDITAGRVIFGPEGVEPILGVTALESTGVELNPKDRSLKRLPAIPFKGAVLAAARA